MGTVPKEGNLKIKLPMRALKFTDATTYVQISHDASISPSQEMTYGVWIKPLSNADGQYPLNKSSNYKDGYGLQIKQNGDIFIGWAGNSTSVTSGSCSLDLNNWTFITLTYASGVGGAIYKDGVSQDTLSNIGNLNSDSDDLYIGAGVFSGSIREIFYYNKKLSDSEVKSLYSRASIPSDYGGYWKFDGYHNPTFLKDYSDYGNSGSINNCTWVDVDMKTWCSRWTEGKWDLTIETFLEPDDRNYLFENTVPGSVRDIANILGVPMNLDTTYESGNTLIVEPIYNTYLSGLREKRTVGVKSISDEYKYKDLFGVKLDLLRLDTGV